MGARPCLRRTRVAPESDANGAGLRAFLGDWTAVFGGWELQLDAFHDAGEKVVVVGVQRGRVSASGGPSIEAPFGLVYTLGDGLLLRGEAYADPAEALKAAGLEP